MAGKKPMHLETTDTGAVKPEAVFTRKQLAASKHFQHRRDALLAVLEEDKRYTVKQAQDLLDAFFGKKVG